MVNKIDIEQEIEALRQKMVSSGLLNGFTHPTTVEISHELDMLLNILQNISLESLELTSN